MNDGTGAGPSLAGEPPLGCPTCAEPVVPADHWCEACGAPLAPGTFAPDGPAPAPWTGAGPAGMAGPAAGAAGPRVEGRGVATPGADCPGCGAPTRAGDGWCARCPRPWAASPGRAPRPSLGAAPGPSPAAAPGPGHGGDRDHRELVAGPVAAVTDRGSSHWRNEDAVGVRWVARRPGHAGHPGGFALVVCDGVSVSQEPHVVSRMAVDAALEVLAVGVAGGGDLDTAVTDATVAAQAAAASVPFDPTLDVGPGACTFVAAAVRGGRAAFASVGDSRAYWVDDRGAVQIGRDDSLAGELVASGAFTAEQAMDRPGAHALTRWLGVDSTDAAPLVTAVDLPGPGLVVLASDGLWNYVPAPGDLARLIGPVGAETSLGLARRLTAFADACGGADNITVAVGPYAADRQEGR